MSFQKLYENKVSEEEIYDIVYKGQDLIESIRTYFIGIHSKKMEAYWK